MGIRDYYKEWPDTDIHKEIIVKGYCSPLRAPDEPWGRRGVRGRDEG